MKRRMWFFYVYQGGTGGRGLNEFRIRAEAAHYAMMYAQDEPVRVVVRRSPKPR